MTHDTTIDVTLDVEGHDTDEQQQAVLDLYEQNAATFLRKNEDYGGSFEDSAKVESILKHGEVRDDEIPEIASRQIFVRGMMDKVSRFYQLGIEGDDALVGDEAVTDTLLDLGNYAIMLASILERYEDTNE